MTNRRERDRRYNASEKGRARHRRYNVTPSGRERSTRYVASLKGRINVMRCEQRRRTAQAESALAALR